MSKLTKPSEIQQRKDWILLCLGDTTLFEYALISPDNDAYYLNATTCHVGICNHFEKRLVKFPNLIGADPVCLIPL